MPPTLRPAALARAPACEAPLPAPRPSRDAGRPTGRALCRASGATVARGGQPEAPAARHARRLRRASPGGGGRRARGHSWGGWTWACNDASLAGRRPQPRRRRRHPTPLDRQQRWAPAAAGNLVMKSCQREFLRLAHPSAGSPWEAAPWAAPDAASPMESPCAPQARPADSPLPAAVPGKL